MLSRRNAPPRGGLASLVHFSLATVACIALASCAVGPDYQPPDAPMPEQFAAAAAKIDHRDSHAVDPGQWWRALHDRELDSLIERAIAGSPTLEMALDRLQQARAQEAAIIGTALPVAGASEGGARGTGSDLARGRASQTLVSAENGAGFTQVNNIVGFDAAWEIDVFGKIRREAESAQYDVDAAAAARNMVLVSLIADVTRAYLEMRALQAQLNVLRKSIQTALAYYNFVKERFDRGITNELDVTLAQRELEQLRAQVMPLVAQIDAARYVIAVLLGEFPESLAKELGKPGVLPILPARIHAGIPLDLLRRRPDIEEAERQLASANALIGVATADLFPRVAITGAGGWQSQGLGVKPVIVSSIWSVGPSIYWPVLDFGTLDALVERADYRARELLFGYKQTVLTAVQQVDTAVDAYAAQQNRLRHLTEALAAARRAVSLAQQRFDRGVTDSLNVIDAERQEYMIEQEYVSAQESAAAQFVMLYKALGGGWEDYQFVPPIPPPLPAVAAAVKRTLFRDAAP